jgi:hypothetical protein
VNSPSSDKKGSLFLMVLSFGVETFIKARGLSTPYYPIAALNVIRLIMNAAPFVAFALFKTYIAHRCIDCSSRSALHPFVVHINNHIDACDV